MNLDSMFEIDPAGTINFHEDIIEAFERWRLRDPLPADADKKIKLMCSYCTKHGETEVPDPYYGGPQGFEKVLDLPEDACESLLENIVGLFLDAAQLRSNFVTHLHFLRLDFFFLGGERGQGGFCDIPVVLFRVVARFYLSGDSW